ncbi:MAG TPA: hypothetical protein V6C99_08305 [Oculatellaceae cyanobacterium]|jgi:hypothetical protein
MLPSNPVSGVKNAVTNVVKNFSSKEVSTSHIGEAVPQKVEKVVTPSVDERVAALRSQHPSFVQIKTRLGLDTAPTLEAPHPWAKKWAKKWHKKSGRW